MLKKILKEPLLQFLTLGAALFVLFEAVSPEDPADLGGNVIQVDREVLLTFIQYRSRTFKPDAAAARLDAMSEAERQRFIDEYVREEALYRKAQSFGMDANDYIIKRRMIQKIEFLAQGFADAAAAPSEKIVKAFYDANKKDYYVQPSINFTHVFFDAKKRGAEAAAAAASAKLERLNADSVPFSDSPRHGDRFPYHVNYVERTPDFVASHFGPALARAVFILKANDRVWQGPYRSLHGFHLVLVSKTTPGKTPALEEVRQRAADDAQRTQARARMEAAIDEIVRGYDVRITDDALGGARVTPARKAR